MTNKSLKNFKWMKEGCWIFKGYKDPRGYGKVKHEGKTLYAHQAFFAHFGGVVPKGKELDHLCGVPSCVRPSHLEPVTHRENQRRGDSFAGTKARQTHCIHGHEFTKANTLVRKDGRRNCRACAQGSDN